MECGARTEKEKKQQPQQQQQDELIEHEERFIGQ